MQEALWSVVIVVLVLGGFIGLMRFCRWLRRRPNAATRVPRHSTYVDKRWQRL